MVANITKEVATITKVSVWLPGWKKRKYLNHPFLAYFGHFSGSLRLILTQPTSHWSYIMPVGSHTSVGTFSAAHHWDERVSEASDLVIFTRFKNA